MNKNCNSAIQCAAIRPNPIRFLLIVFLIFSPFFSQSQQAEQSGKMLKDTGVKADYSRSSLTLLLLEPDRSSTLKRFKGIMSQTQVPDKFNDNNLQQRSLVISGFERDADNIFQQQALNRGVIPETGLDKIYLTLKDQRLANEVIAKWWARKDDGTFGVELLQERGAYDATDAEVIAARAGIRGMAGVMDAGEELINKSYILVFDFYNTKTMDQYYNDVDNNRRELARQLERDYTPVERNMEGYRTDIMAHLFRIDYNDSVSAVFYQEMWIDPENDDIQTRNAKRNQFDEFKFPLAYVTSVKTTIQSAQSKKAVFGKKTDDQLFEKLVEDAIDDVLFQFSTRYEDFRVKTAVYNTRPIQAKIGRKEGVSVDQRYFVYEYQLNTQGEAVPVRKGVIRASNKITDNRQVATGETSPSKFYQVAGRRIQPGMLIQQQNDFGLGITMGYGIDSEIIGSGFWVMAELNISQIMGRAGGQLSPGIKLFVDAGFDGIDDDDLPLSIIAVSGGLSKDLYLLRNVHVAPFLGIGYESVSPKEDGSIIANNEITSVEKNGELLFTLYGTAGARLGINLRHNIQLLPSVTYQLGNYNDYVISNENLEDMELVLPAGLRNRVGGLQTRIGLRIQL
jgi:hypothetical protein